MEYKITLDVNSKESESLLDFLRNLNYVKDIKGEVKPKKEQTKLNISNFKDAKIAVFGGGSWATAIVKILLNNTNTDNHLNWYMRNEEAIKSIKDKQRNPRYLSSVKLETDKINLFNDINKIIEQSDILIFAIPSAFLKDALKNLKIDLKNKIIVSAIKGIVPETNTIIGAYFHEEHQVPLSSVVIIAGPCHAEEVALERLSYLTIASKDINKAYFVAQKLNCNFIKTSISDDVYGTEYSSVLKNIFAIAAGICHSLGYGDNFQAVLISNAIQEIKRFVDTVHPINRDIKSSVYLGDLLVTAYSQFSRNRTFGTMIGKGYSVKFAQLEMNMIAEGYYALNCIHTINKKFRVNMPITESIYKIVYKNKSAKTEIQELTKNLI